MLHCRASALASQRAHLAGAGLMKGAGRCLAAASSFAPLPVNDVAQKTNLTTGSPVATGC